MIQFKKLSDNAIVPKHMSSHAAGLDLFSNNTEDITIKPFERVLIKTDISVLFPEGYYGRVAPRSGLSLKNGIHTLAGVIDQDYHGNIGVILYNLSAEDFTVQKHTRIAQLIITKIIENYVIKEVKNFNELSSQRGSKGFGSTGLN